MPAPHADIAGRKAAFRGPLLARRRSMSPADRAAARDRIAAHLLAEFDRIAPESSGPVPTVAAFLALPTEPLAPSVLDALVDRFRVLVPVVTGAGPLDWCRHEPTAKTVPGSAGIDEPAGTRLGPATIGAVDLVLLPALAVDRDGYRMGRGGGHYDRTLALAHQLGVRPRLIGVVYDDEWVDELPHDDLDVPVDAVVTPTWGLQQLR